MTKVPPEPMVMENTDGSLAILQPPEQWPDGTQIDVDSLTRRLESHLGTYDASPQTCMCWFPTIADLMESSFTTTLDSAGVFHATSVSKWEFRLACCICCPAVVYEYKSTHSYTPESVTGPYTYHFSRVIYQPDRKDKREKVTVEITPLNELQSTFFNTGPNGVEVRGTRVWSDDGRTRTDTLHIPLSAFVWCPATFVHTFHVRAEPPPPPPAPPPPPPPPMNIHGVGATFHFMGGFEGNSEVNRPPSGDPDSAVQVI